MERDIFIESDDNQTRLALHEDGDLVECWIERTGNKRLTGNIYLGRVKNILQGMEAAFIDIGLKKNAFMQASDMNADFIKNNLPVDSKKLFKLTVNGEIVVQVIKETGANKGLRVSPNISLPGEYMVFMPFINHIGISKKITDGDERERLKQVAQSLCAKNCGIIIRTSAQGASESVLINEFIALNQLWRDIYSKAKNQISPCLLYNDSYVPERAMRDLVNIDTLGSIITDNAAVYDHFAEMLAARGIDAGEKLHLHNKNISLFDAYNIEKSLEKSMARRIWLKSGGFIIIEPTEALTVIDVNTGKYVGKSSQSDTIYKTNIEAADEIARQIRLRDIGGIIIVDFIDMSDPEHKNSVINKLTECSAYDRGRVKISGFSNAGLIEITRKKIRASLDSIMMEICPCCSGGRMVKSDETVAFDALQDMKNQFLRFGENNDIIISAHTDIISLISRLMPPGGVNIYLKPDANMHKHKYNITKLIDDENKNLLKLWRKEAD